MLWTGLLDVPICAVNDEMIMANPQYPKSPHLLHYMKMHMHVHEVFLFYLNYAMDRFA